MHTRNKQVGVRQIICHDTDTDTVAQKNTNGSDGKCGSGSGGIHSLGSSSDGDGTGGITGGDGRGVDGSEGRGKSPNRLLDVKQSESTSEQSSGKFGEDWSKKSSERIRRN